MRTQNKYEKMIIANQQEDEIAELKSHLFIVKVGLFVAIGISLILLLAATVQ